MKMFATSEKTAVAERLASDTIPRKRGSPSHKAAHDAGHKKTSKTAKLKRLKSFMQPELSSQAVGLWNEELIEKLAPRKVDPIVAQQPGLGAPGGGRQIRTAIQSIVRDQDQMRETANLATARTYWVTIGVAALAVLASTATLFPEWCGVLLPTFTSAIFVTTSAAESSGVRSKGISRFASAEVLELTAQQETGLAQAEYTKAGLPFLVGITAIFAAACVSFKVVNEGAMGQESLSLAVLLTFLSILSALASLVGALVSADLTLKLDTELKLLELQSKAKAKRELNAWEAARKKQEDSKEPETRTRVASAAFTIAVCIWASLTSLGGFEGLGQLQTMVVKGEFEEVIERVNSLGVVLSAVAAALAAVSFLFAEKDFADAERRIAILAKQGSLAELFYAQTAAEAAGLPVSTAIAGAALGGAAAAVELATAAAALAPWTAVASALRSTADAGLTLVEADATWIESKLTETGTGKASDTTEATGRELKRAYDELVNVDTFYDEMRATLMELPPGEQMEFANFPSAKRRKVHLAAADLGLQSQSFSPSIDERVIVVQNFGVTPVVPDATADKNDTVVLYPSFEIVDQLRNEIRALMLAGVPAGSEKLLGPAAALSLLAIFTPALFGKVAAGIVLPLATGSVGVLTVFQESEGKKMVAKVKESAGRISAKQAVAEKTLGLASTTASALPSYVAISLCAATASFMGFESKGAPWGVAISLASLIVTTASQILAIDRQKRVRRYICSALNQLGGKPPSPSMLRGKRWVIVPISALFLPLDFPRRAAIAATVLSVQIGLVMATCSEQIAAGHHYAGRYTRAMSRVEAWSQQASNTIRALPLNSAAAVVNTLLATALVTVSTPLATLFPAVGFGVCVRAVQFSRQAEKDAKISLAEGRDMQKPDSENEPPWFQTELPDGMGGATIDVEGTVTEPGDGDALVDEPGQAIARPRGYRRQKYWKLATKIPTNTAWRMIARRFCTEMKEKPPENAFRPSPARIAVDKVQADLDELRISTTRGSGAMGGVGAFVAVASAIAVVSPLVLPAALTEVLLPVAGAGLTLVAVSAESDARRSVAASKVRTAELDNALGVASELLATADVYRSRLLGILSISTGLAMTTLILEHPCHGAFFLKILVAMQVGLSAYSTLPMLGVMNWALRSKRSDARTLRRLWRQQITLVGLKPTETVFGALPKKENQRVATQTNVRRLSFVAVLPTVLPLFLPCGSFARRAVISTALGAFTLTLSMYLAERSCASAERSAAIRQRVQSLSDTFANEAEQQGALLPCFSAATIAISAVLTFVTELNPYVASTLTFFQGVAWLLSFRKGIATKIESAAALQVNDEVSRKPLGTAGSVFCSREGAPSVRSTKDIAKRVRRLLLN